MYAEDIDYSKLDERLRGGMQRWIERAILPGDYLCACLRNDLRSAFDKVDDSGPEDVKRTIRWLYWNAPYLCWGSPERIAVWEAVGGIKNVADALALDSAVGNIMQASSKRVHAIIEGHAKSMAAAKREADARERECEPGAGMEAAHRMK